MTCASDDTFVPVDLEAVRKRVRLSQLKVPDLRHIRDVDVPALIAEVERLREALGDCWGEAYLAGIRDEGPSPMEACNLVIRYAQEALGARPRRGRAAHV